MSEGNDERAEGVPASPVGSPPPERGADPGWYRLSRTDPQWWWWDGTRWTEHMTMGPNPEAISSMMNELRQHAGKMQKDIGFIATVLRLLVVLWVFGIFMWVVAYMV